MVEIISVRFKEGGKQYYFNPNGERFRLGEGVIVETARGVEFGECTQENTAVDEMELTAPLRPGAPPGHPGGPADPGKK